MHRSIALHLIVLTGSVIGLAQAAPDWKTVEPVLKSRCYECHGGAKTKGGINLKELAADPKVTQEFELWEKVLDTVDNGDMPPPKAKPLASKEKDVVLGWVNHALEAIGEPGDPGQVTMRRLTNAEYDYTVRDLTGQEFAFAKEFQSDGGGGEGFSNTGDVLFVSPRQLDQYFAAARQIADHATILPGTGVQFHAQRIGLRGPEQWKAQAEQGLYVWYQQKSAPFLPKDLEDMREADYMVACWKHKHWQEPLEKLAKDNGLRFEFLSNWWNVLNSVDPKSRFLDLTRVAWRELPGPDPAKPKEVPGAVVSKINSIRDDLLSWNNPKKPGSGVQRQQQDADGIRPYTLTQGVKGKNQVFLCVGDVADGNKGDVALVKVQFKRAPKWDTVNYLDWLKRRLDDDKKALAVTPPPANFNPEPVKQRIAEAEKLIALFGKHPQPGRTVDPAVLVLSAPVVQALPLPPEAVEFRAEFQLDMQNPDVDSATIQWALAVDQPRDVTKIMPGILTVWKRSTDIAFRTMNDFNVMKTAFPDMYERRLEQVANNLYRGKAGYTVYYLSDDQLAAVVAEADRKQLEAMKKDWSFTAPKQLNDQRKKEWDDIVLGHLKTFAARAWRRPLAEEEKANLVSLYQQSMSGGLDRESAAREVIVRVLVSPSFLFKAEPHPESVAAGTGIDAPLGAWAVASRLSYFLWSSLPDWELRKAAEDGSLLKPDVLAAQAKRLLRDPRANALSKEFAGQWLGFNGFDAQNTVDEKKFPEFTPEIRADLYQESLVYFSKFFREDHAVSEIVGGDSTYLNERLAKFYGIPGVTGPEFRQVKVADQHRGGVLGMGSILVKTSRPHRTSPVLRGNYLYQVVLGQSAPPPPPNVPKLPENAVKPASLREALAIHRADQACSVCHDRIDPLGFALESFDPIGRFRVADDSGGKIDDTGVLKDGTTFQGLDGLRNYLKSRQSDIDLQFCRKLLGYALGRQVIPTDKPLLAQMQESLKANGGKVSAAVVTVVQSRQFLNARKEPTVAAAP